MYWGDKIEKLYGFQKTFELKDFINLWKGSLYFYILIWVKRLSLMMCHWRNFGFSPFHQFQLYGACLTWMLKRFLGTNWRSWWSTEIIKNCNTSIFFFIIKWSNIILFLLLIYLVFLKNTSENHNAERTKTVSCRTAIF